jgi:hypothetical protein
MPTNPPPASDATPTPGAMRDECRAMLERIKDFGLDDVRASLRELLNYYGERDPTPGAGGAGDVGVDDLERKARAACGPWWDVTRDEFAHVATPAAVLALIDRLRAAEARNVDLWAVIDKLTADGCRAVTALIKCEAERDALRAAVEPFAKMASGIPDNWPGDVVLFYDIANPAYPERALNLGYWPAWFNDGGWRPTIDDYRRIAALARGPAAGETTDGGGTD